MEGVDFPNFSTVIMMWKTVNGANGDTQAATPVIKLQLFII